ncbi:MAG: methylmalonyl-CoA mutase [Rhizobiaceae bacterium]|nr:methylmalonyl-CoA mutase [Rhizobiaceae bacterium]
MTTAGLIGENTFPALDRAAWARVADASAPSVGLADAPWTLVQRVDDPDPVRANIQARDDVANGATGLSLVFEGAPNAFGYGLPARQDALSAALAGIDLDRVHLRIDVHPSSRASADWLAALIASRRADPTRLSISFGIDPAATFAGTGRLRMSIEALRASMPQSMAHFFAIGVPGVLLEADGRVFHNAGATAAQELGIVIAAAVSHLRLFEEARQALVHAVPHIGFAIAAEQDQVETAAKVLALRKLWSEVQRRSHLVPARASIHAETSFRMMTGRNSALNRIRAVLAAAGAGAAGADTVSVVPHSAARGLSGPAARRQALEGHLVAVYEAGADRLRASPACGTDLADLVDLLCEEAWDEFRRIEAESGVLRSIAAGHVQKRVLASRAELEAAYASGARRLIGARDPHEVEGEMLEAGRPSPPEDGVIFCERLDPFRLEEAVS